MQFWLQFLWNLQAVFFLGKAKEDKKPQYQPSFMSYKSFIELHTLNNGWLIYLGLNECGFSQRKLYKSIYTF